MADLTAWLAAGTDPLLVSGVTMNCQLWYRDPTDPFGVGLTNALELTVE